MEVTSVTLVLFLIQLVVSKLNYCDDDIYVLCTRLKKLPSNAILVRGFKQAYFWIIPNAFLIKWYVFP